MAPSAAEGALIPLERELQERLDWFIRLRWLAAAGIAAGAWLTTTYVAAELLAEPLYGVGAVVLLYNAAFIALRRRFGSEAASLKRFIYLQIGLDWLALVFLVHYSGGVQSPVALAFTFHLIIGTILLSRRACYLLALVAAALSGALTLAEENAWWPPPLVDSLYVEPPCGIWAGYYHWLSLAFLFWGTAFLATSITARLRQKEEALFASERQLDRAYREMEALYQLGQIVNATFDLDEVLGLISENGARLLDMKACSIILLDHTGKSLYIGGTYGLSRAYLDKGPVDLGKSQINAEALQGRVVQVLDASSDPRFQYPEEARREGIASVLCVPVAAGSRTLGVLRVYAAVPHRFSAREQNLLQNLANLGAVAIENVNSYAELRALSEERAWFARMTHHQLRAPLAAVGSALDALPYAGPLSDKQRDLVDRGQRRVTDAFDTIRDLLDMAAAQRPLDEEEIEEVDLNAVLERIVENIRERAASKGVELEVKMPQAATVRARAEDMDRIFSNLLDNGVKYTPAGGRVGLRLDRVGDSVRVEVSDTGIGIDAEDQERIFEGFYRSAAAKASGEMGTGLGLSIVKRLVERWGGELALRSAPGTGSHFVATFPVGAAP